jgi:Mg-chelatase subunit ChlD
MKALAAALHIVLLVDTSGSMTDRFPFRKGDDTLLPAATAGLAAALRPDETSTVSSFGNGGASPLWDILDEAVRSLAGADGRRAIVVITDGRTTGNTRSFADVLPRLQQSGVPVYFICAERPGEPAWIADPARRLRRISEATGGRYSIIKKFSGISRPNPKEVGRAIGQLVDDIRKDTRPRIARISR